ncbi:hypothetical protein IPJ72_05995 [Candidatus Peregrinibacteria bacterium]|nr:MAG: hypothetical protein IPJ72_05995 [Candidatus Peregrinibacteria bacterium]
MVHSTLIDLGFHPKEAAIYLTLLPLGQAHVSTLARKVSLSRTTATYHCEQMVKRGIARRYKKDQTYVYVPEAPERISQLLEERANAYLEKRDKANRIINNLHQIINPDFSLPKVRFLNGLQGIQQAYEDTLILKEPIYAFENVEVMAPQVKEYIFNTYIPERIKQKTLAKVITLKITQISYSKKQTVAHTVKLDLLVKKIYHLILK